MSTPRGVRAINENVIQPGRGLVITDMNDIEWGQIPDGSLFVDPVDGIIQVKLKGETTWTPTGIKNDGTLCIARDTALTVETFTVTSLDNGDGTFTYKNTNGEQRYKAKLDDGYVFELEEGSYIPGRNHLTVVFDDVLERSAKSGGVVELDSTRFKITEEIPVGTELTVKYIKWVRIGNPYPRVYENNNEPAEAETGDFWLDLDGTLDNLDGLDDDTMSQLRISWEQIDGKPTTIQGYKLTEPFSFKGHTHTTSEIVGLAKALDDAIPDEIDAVTLQGLSPDSDRSAQPNTIAVYNREGKLPLIAMPFAKGMIIDWFGSPANVPEGWHICDGEEGTPDLRNKFIISGASYDYNANQIQTVYGSSGGNNSQTVQINWNNLPPHNHDRGNLNITGWFGCDDKTTTTYGGAFYDGGWGYDTGSQRSETGNIFRFDATRCPEWINGRTGVAYGYGDGHWDPVTVSTIPPFVALFKIMYIGA